MDAVRIRVQGLVKEHLTTLSFHVMRGKDLLDEQRIDAASKQFDLGLELESEYAPALAGKAYVLTLQSQQVGLEPGKAVELLEESENLLEKALSNAEGPNEELCSIIGNAYNYS